MNRGEVRSGQSAFMVVPTDGGVMLTWRHDLH
jgi:hypothetical protein